MKILITGISGMLVVDFWCIFRSRALKECLEERKGL